MERKGSYLDYISARNQMKKLNQVQAYKTTSVLLIQSSRKRQPSQSKSPPTGISVNQYGSCLLKKLLTKERKEKLNSDLDYEVSPREEKKRALDDVKNLDMWEEHINPSQINFYARNLSKQLLSFKQKGGYTIKSPRVNVYNLNLIMRPPTTEGISPVQSSRTLEDTEQKSRGSKLFSSEALLSPTAQYSLRQMSSQPGLRFHYEKNIAKQQQKKTGSTKPSTSPMDMRSTFNSTKLFSSQSLRKLQATNPEGFKASLVKKYSSSDPKLQRDKAVKSIISTIQAAGERSAKERNRMEHQLEQECKRLQIELAELKATRKSLLKENNKLHLKVQNIRETILEGEDELKRIVEEFRFAHQRTRGSKFQMKEIEELNKQRDAIKILKESKQKSEVEAKRIRENNSVQITFLEKQMEILRTEFNFLQTTQRQYYSKLLKEGTDCRGKGLWWIVKELFKVGVTIDITNFPEVIDEENAQYLKSVAKIMLKIERQEKEEQMFQMKLSMTSSNKMTAPQSLEYGLCTVGPLGAGGTGDCSPDSGKWSKRVSSRQPLRPRNRYVLKEQEVKKKSNYYEMKGSSLFQKRSFSLTDNNWFKVEDGKPCIDLKKVKILENMGDALFLRQPSMKNFKSRGLTDLHFSKEIDFDTSEIQRLPTSRATLLRSFEYLRQKELKRIQGLLENPFSKLRRKKTPVAQLSEMMFGNKNSLYDFQAGLMDQMTQLVASSPSISRTTYFSTSHLAGGGESLLQMNEEL